MRRTDGLQALLTLAFMDSGRIGDEFEPGLRRQFRTDALILLAIGVILIAIGAIAAFLLPQELIGIVLLVVGAILVAAAVLILWASK